jgi:ElaB/YqjD/DUF883 family membrane-anchored ribosome-binding protein
MAKETSVEDLSKQIDALKNDLSALTQTLADYGVAKSETAANAAKDKALEAQLHAEEFIRTQPATSLGLAAGLGFLVGLITARR